ncbi:MAG: HDIG domain-containing protein [candidate division Zixibacteria bacterium]|nr:HDIG domain-containing protein [candidate division Zixibacteria bacterium]
MDKTATNGRLVTIDQVLHNDEITAWIVKADYYLGRQGYTEHGLRHCKLVSKIAYNVLERLGKPDRVCQLAAIAAYMHDIGNAINREYHAQTGAMAAYTLLHKMGLATEEAVDVAAAIGNHDDKEIPPVSDIAAAVILADKSDVHSSRVRNLEQLNVDIHDRVNYAAKASFLRVDPDKQNITLEIKIDDSIASVMEYFEIFLTRMVMCRNAATFLGMKFELDINGNKLL